MVSLFQEIIIIVTCNKRHVLFMPNFVNQFEKLSLNNLISLSGLLYRAPTLTRTFCSRLIKANMCLVSMTYIAFKSQRSTKCKQLSLQSATPPPRSSYLFFVIKLQPSMCTRFCLKSSSQVSEIAITENLRFKL